MRHRCFFSRSKPLCTRPKLWAAWLVITHPHDDDVRGFDARWGFQDLPFDPRRAMFVRMVDLQAAFCT
jgi:hypothetical protein